MNFERLYEHRHRSVDQPTRQAVWRYIATDIYERMGRPVSVLDPAAGRGEFINAVPAKERWAVDAVAHPADLDPDVHQIVANVLTVELPEDHFDGVFVSSFLEHLASPEEIAAVLHLLYSTLAPGGRIAVLGPNFRYCAKTYFDFADHVVPLSHIAVEEHLYAAGFEIGAVIPRYLPLTFRGVLPPSPRLTQLYLRARPLWRILGKQFLILGSRPAA